MSRPASQWPDPKPSEPIASADGLTQAERMRAIAESARAYRALADSKKASHGRLGSLLRLDRAHVGLKRVATATHRYVDRSFQAMHVGVSLLERAIVRFDALIDALMSRDVSAPQPADDIPTPAELVQPKPRSRKTQRRPRARCIVVTRPQSVESDAKLDPVPPQRKPGKKRVPTPSVICAPGRAESELEPRMVDVSPTTADSKTVRVSVAGATIILGQDEPTTVHGTQDTSLPTPIERVGPDPTPNVAVASTAVPDEQATTPLETPAPASSSASAHGRGKGFPACVDRIGSVSAANENRSSRADDEWTAALLGRLLIHHLLGRLIAAGHGAQKLFYELLSQIVAGIARATIGIRQKCIGIIRAARAVALRTIARVHDRLRGMTVLPGKRRRQRRSRKKRKSQKAPRKPVARRGGKRAGQSRDSA